MKKYRAFYTIQILILCFLCIFIFAGCSGEEIKDSNESSDSNSDFVAVQSVEYTNKGELNNSYDYKTIKSYCYIDYSQETVSATEYENSENKIYWLKNELEIGKNGKASNGLSIEELKDLSNKTFYYQESSGNIYSSNTNYYKVTFSNVIISYVNVKFFEDGSFLAKRLDSNGATITTRIKPLYYSVFYFNE